MDDRCPYGRPIVRQSMAIIIIETNSANWWLKAEPTRQLGAECGIRDIKRVI